MVGEKFDIDTPILLAFCSYDHIKTGHELQQTGIVDVNVGTFNYLTMEATRQIREEGHFVLTDLLRCFAYGLDELSLTLPNKSSASVEPAHSISSEDNLVERIEEQRIMFGLYEPPKTVIQSSDNLNLRDDNVTAFSKVLKGLQHRGVEYHAMIQTFGQNPEFLDVGYFNRDGPTVKNKKLNDLVRFV